MKSYYTTPPPKRIQVLLISIIAGFILILISESIVSSVDYHNSDFFTFWLSGRLASQGLNPYDRNVWVSGHHQYGVTWIPNDVFVYPLQVSLLFLPLSLLDLFWAFVVWDLLLQLMIIASIILLHRAITGRSGSPYLLSLIGGVIIFRPALVTLTNGQFSGFLLLLLAGVVYLWENERWTLGAALLPFLMLKPNLGGPILVLLSIYLIREKKISALITAGIAGILFVVIGWIQNPRWIAEYWIAGNTKISQIFGFSPNIWGLAFHLCGYDLPCAYGFGTIFSLLFVIAFLFLIARRSLILSPAFVVSSAVVIMLLVTPTCWPYDQLLLLIPIVTVTMSMAKMGYRFLPVSLVFIGIDLFAWMLFALAFIINKDVWTVCVPLLISGLLIWVLIIRKNAPKSIVQRIFVESSNPSPPAEQSQ